MQRLKSEKAAGRNEIRNKAQKYRDKLERRLKKIIKKIWGKEGYLKE